MLVSLDLPQGLYRQGTVYQAKGRWYEAQLVRFLEDTVRPIGGWTRMSESVAASLYASDLFTADPGNISLDYTTSGYVSPLGFGGWDVETPADKQLEPDPSTHLVFKDITGDASIKSRNAIAVSDFAAYMDVKWTDGDDGDTQVGMYVRTNDFYQTEVGSEGLLFTVQMHHGSLTTYFQDDCSGPSAAPDEGIAGNFYITRQGGAYELTSVVSGRVPALYTTPFVSENFEFFVDVTRSSITFGAPGILFLSDGSGSDHCCLYGDPINSTDSAIKVHRFDGGYQDQEIPASSIAWPEGGALRLGVRVGTTQQMGLYYADAITGANEVYLGPWTITVPLVGDPTRVYFGVQNTEAKIGQGSKWDNLTLTPHGGVEFLILDTFTRGAGTQLANTWTSDTGETYPAGSHFDVSGDIDGGVLVQNTLGQSPENAYQSGDVATSGAVCLEGYEVYCDLYHATGHSGTDAKQGFFFMKDWYTAPQAFYRFNVIYTGDSGQCQMVRDISALPQYGNDLGTVSHPQDSWLRYGVTVISAHSYQLWWEPKGGGTRTLLDIWNPTPQESYYNFLGNSNYRWMGAWSQQTGSVTGQYPAWDNLTMRNPPVAPSGDDGFHINALRVIDGIPYQLGYTIENDYFSTVSWADGFRYGVDIEGSEAKAWYQAFGGTSTKVYLDWTGLTAGDPLDLTTSAGGSTDDYDDAGHQYSGIWENIEAHLVGTEIYRYEYQQLGFSGPFDLEGTPRGAHGWEQASVGWLAFGTNEKLYTYSTGFLYDITPAGYVTGRVDTETSEENSGRYGRGVYGNLTYGTGQQGIVETFEAAVWHFDTFEDSLMSASVPTDSTLYEWNPVWGGAAPALAVTIANGYAEDAPAVGRGIVVTPERFMCILGPDGANRDVAWASRETIDIWTIDPLVPANTAGQQTLDGKGRIMRGMRGRGETIIWTDADVFAMTYQAGEYIYGFERRGFNCGLIAPLAVADIGSMFVWMSLRGFFIYDGYSRVLECPVQDAIFGELDFDQRVKIAAVVNQMFGEVWWFYPSIPADVDAQGECDRFVVYNFREELWTMGQIERTCGVEASASAKNPLMLSPQGWAYNHEVGWLHPDESGVEIVPYIESGPVQLGEGDVVLSANKLIPDEKNLGDVQAYFYGSFWPMEDETEYGPYTLNDETDVRITARQIRIRLEQNVDDDWRVGVFRFDALQGSQR